MSPGLQVETTRCLACQKIHLGRARVDRVLLHELRGFKTPKQVDIGDICRTGSSELQTPWQHLNHTHTHTRTRCCRPATERTAANGTANAQTGLLTGTHSNPTLDTSFSWLPDGGFLTLVYSKGTRTQATCALLKLSFAAAAS